jgi:hypothetical protein
MNSKVPPGGSCHSHCGRMKKMLIEREVLSAPPFDSCSKPTRAPSKKALASRARSHFQKTDGR